MPCVDRELGYAGLKSFAWLPAGTPFIVVLFSIAHARVEAIVEADVLGQRRTAAASAVAAHHLARRDARTLGVFGCGRQAASHVAALRAALPALERVLVHGRDAGRVEEFCRANGCEPSSRLRRPAAATSSSRQRRRRSLCCAANGCTRARSSAPSVRTTPRRASSTTPCWSGRASCAPTRATRRVSRRAT